MDVKTQYTPVNITTGTNLIATGNGVLHSLVFNKPVATGTVTIYNQVTATGTKIATITVPASPQPVTLIYDCAFAIGLTIVIATADQDITVNYAQG